MKTPSPTRTGTRPAPQGRNFVASLAKGLEILALFERNNEYSNQELAAITGLPKATVSRFTSTLVALGYLRQDEASRRFSIGTRVLGLSASVHRHIGLQRAARPLMDELAARTGLSVGMGTRDRLGVVFLELVRPAQRQLVINADVGTILPLESTALGRAYVVGCAVAERQRIIRELQQRHPHDWPAIRGIIERAHAEFERYGLVTAQRSWGRDVSGVAVPFQLGARRRLFVFNCSGPAHELTPRQLHRHIGPQLLEMVAMLRRRMREQPEPPMNPPSVHRP
jgi:DNA-binding IclR family transcriptional regulator